MIIHGKTIFCPFFYYVIFTVIRQLRYETEHGIALVNIVDSLKRCDRTNLITLTGIRLYNIISALKRSGIAFIHIIIFFRGIIYIGRCEYNGGFSGFRIDFL